MERFLALIETGGNVLDIGCGTGRPLAHYCIARGYSVLGIDSSANMVSICRARFPGQEWLVADMRGLCTGRRFAGLIAWDSFFHLAHDAQRAMFATFAAHALPGAALMFTSGTTHGEAIGEFEGEELYHASLSEVEYRGLLESHGFQVLARRADDADCGGHTVWLAQYGVAARQGANPVRSGTTEA